MNKNIELRYLNKIEEDGSSHLVLQIRYLFQHPNIWTDWEDVPVVYG